MVQNINAAGNSFLPPVEAILGSGRNGIDGFVDTALGKTLRTQQNADGLKKLLYDAGIASSPDEAGSLLPAFSYAFVPYGSSGKHLSIRRTQRWGEEPIYLISSESPSIRPY